MNALTDDQWQQYERDGYLKLGRLLSDSELAALQQRIDDIMMGRAKVDYDQMLMQLDGGGDDYSGGGGDDFSGGGGGANILESIRETSPMTSTSVSRF